MWWGRSARGDCFYWQEASFRSRQQKPRRRRRHRARRPFSLVPPVLQCVRGHVSLLVDIVLKRRPLPSHLRRWTNSHFRFVFHSFNDGARLFVVAPVDALSSQQSETRYSINCSIICPFWPAVRHFDPSRLSERAVLF